MQCIDQISNNLNNFLRLKICNFSRNPNKIYPWILPKFVASNQARQFSLIWAVKFKPKYFFVIPQSLLVPTVRLTTLKLDISDNSKEICIFAFPLSSLGWWGGVNLHRLWPGFYQEPLGRDMPSLCIAQWVNECHFARYLRIGLFPAEWFFIC